MSSSPKKLSTNLSKLRDTVVRRGEKAKVLEQPSVSITESAVQDAVEKAEEEPAKSVTAAAPEPEQGGWSLLPGLTYANFKRVVAPYWGETKENNDNAWMWLGITLLLSLAGTGVGAEYGILSRQMVDRLQEKNLEGTYDAVKTFLGLVAIGAPVYGLKDYSSWLLMLRWRKWQTKHFSKKYFANRSFYNVQLFGYVDNIDQRLTEDIKFMCDQAMQNTVVAFRVVTDLVVFSSVLASVDVELVYLLIGYSCIGTYLTTVIGSGLTDLYKAQGSVDGSLRYSLMRVRENAETIALYQGEKTEERVVMKRLGAVLSNLREILTRQRNLEVYQTYYGYLVTALPLIILAPKVYSGEVGLGVLSQSQSAFFVLMTDLSLLVNQYKELSNFSAVVNRLSELDAGFEKARDLTTKFAMQEPGSEMSTQTSEGHSFIKFLCLTNNAEGGRQELLRAEKMCLTVPTTKRPLVQNLSFSVSTGDSMLVMGPSGVGKSSLLRALVNLWGFGSGTVHRVRGTFFVPQKPYMLLGTLREQMLYPTWSDWAEENDGGFDTRCDGEIPAVPTDEQLIEILHKVGLKQLASVDELNKEIDWAATLSLGEQQRLGVARCLLAKPKLALLDEATSAMDATRENIVYTALHDAGITYVSVGHRHSLIAHHSKVLNIESLEEHRVEDASAMTAR